MSLSERDEQAQAAVLNARPNRRGWARGNCPFCDVRIGKPDRKQCFGLNVLTNRFHCFRCGMGGRLRVPFDPHAAAPEEDAPDEVQPPEHFMPLYEEPLVSALSGQAPREYLRDVRGLDEGVCRAAKVGACLRGRYAGRVIVPAYDDDGGWLWWVGRAWTKKVERPYIYPSGDREGVIYNHASLLVEDDAPALVVEGTLDALALWPDGAALLGKHGEAQVAGLVAARRSVAVVLDGDAWREGEMLALRLRFEGQRAGSVRLPAGTDPDEHDAAAVRQAALRSLETYGPVSL